MKYFSDLSFFVCTCMQSNHPIDLTGTLLPDDLALHYQASNGAVYTLPHSHRSQSIDSQAALLNSEIFDGECYASTYRTNGQMHVYQELEKHFSDHVGGSVPIRGNSFRSHHRGSIPRFSAASVAQFPYTMPNTPAPSYPYLDAIPGPRPRPPAIPLPHTPEETPVRYVPLHYYSFVFFGVFVTLKGC